MKRFWHLGIWLILLPGIVACQTQKSVIVATAVPTTPTSQPTVVSTIPAPPAITPKPTSLPRPTNTPSPTPQYPKIGDLTQVAVLPQFSLGNIINFRRQPGNPEILELFSANDYYLINTTTGEAAYQFALPGAKIIGIDDSGTVWHQPEHDRDVIWSLDDRQHGTFGAAQGWLPPFDAPRGFVEDANGHVWLATNKDVRQFDGTRWTIYSREDLGMPSAISDDALGSIFQVAYASLTQTVWVGQCDRDGPGPFAGGGARWFDGTSWQGADSPAASGCVTEIVEAGNGRIWIALDQYLWQFNPADESWQQFTPPDRLDGLRIGFTAKLFLDHAGNPWPFFSLCGQSSCYAGFAQYRLRDGEWTLFGDVYAPLSELPILAFSPNNQPLFFSHQLTTYTPSDEPVIVEDFPLNVAGAISDEAGNLWLLGRPSSDLPLAVWHTNLDD